MIGSSTTQSIARDVEQRHGVTDTKLPTNSRPSEHETRQDLIDSSMPPLAPSAQLTASPAIPEPGRPQPAHSSNQVKLTAAKREASLNSGITLLLSGISTMISGQAIITSANALQRLDGESHIKSHLTGLSACLLGIGFCCYSAKLFGRAGAIEVQLEALKLAQGEDPCPPLQPAL